VFVTSVVERVAVKLWAPKAATSFNGELDGTASQPPKRRACRESSFLVSRTSEIASRDVLQKRMASAKPATTVNVKARSSESPPGAPSGDA
jgi:hypothetical protein